MYADTQNGAKSPVSPNVCDTRRGVQAKNIGFTRLIGSADERLHEE
jgi:hypothetical protein